MADFGDFGGGGAAPFISTPQIDTITVTPTSPDTFPEPPIPPSNPDGSLPVPPIPPANPPPSNVQGQAQQTPTAGTQTSSSPQSPTASIPSSPNVDFRIRLASLDTSIYTGILVPLSSTSGLMFPYTPQIAFSQSVNYMDLQLVHSNTDYPAYTRTPSATISITGKFTVQSQAEGQYALACVHFLRAVSKMHFGETDTQAGLPPPVLTLNGYGKYMFNAVRVILKSHSWTFDDQIDMVNIAVASGLVRLPALFSLSCELTVVQTPQRMRTQFNFNQFASGQLMQQQEGWI